MRSLNLASTPHQEYGSVSLVDSQMRSATVAGALPAWVPSSKHPGVSGAGAISASDGIASGVTGAGIVYDKSSLVIPSPQFWRF
jgi:hypothetical protein